MCSSRACLTQHRVQNAYSMDWNIVASAEQMLKMIPCSPRSFGSAILRSIQSGRSLHTVKFAKYVKKSPYHERQRISHIACQCTVPRSYWECDSHAVLSHIHTQAIQNQAPAWTREQVSHLGQVSPLRESSAKIPKPTSASKCSSAILRSVLALAIANSNEASVGSSKASG